MWVRGIVSSRHISVAKCATRPGMSFRIFRGLHCRVDTRRILDPKGLFANTVDHLQSTPAVGDEREGCKYTSTNHMECQRAGTLYKNVCFEGPNPAHLQSANDA